MVIGAGVCVPQREHPDDLARRARFDRIAGHADRHAIHRTDEREAIRIRAVSPGVAQRVVVELAAVVAPAGPVAAEARIG